MQQWYCLRDGVAFGPFPSARLRELAAAGELVPASEVRLGADGKWRRADTIAGLTFGKPPAAPVIDPFAQAVAAPRRIAPAAPPPSRVPAILLMILPAAALCGFAGWKWLSVPTTGQLAVSFSPAELPPGVVAKLNGREKSAAELKSLTLAPGDYSLEVFDGSKKVKAAHAKVAAGSTAVLALELPKREPEPPPLRAPDPPPRMEVAEAPRNRPEPPAAQGLAGIRMTPERPAPPPEPRFPAFANAEPTAAAPLLGAGPAADHARDLLTRSGERRGAELVRRVVREAEKKFPEAAKDDVGFQYALALVLEPALLNGQGSRIEALAAKVRNPVLSLLVAQRKWQAGNRPAALEELRAWDYSKPLPKPLFAQLALCDFELGQNNLTAGADDDGAATYRKVQADLVGRRNAGEAMVRARRQELERMFNDADREVSKLDNYYKSLQQDDAFTRRNLAAEQGRQVAVGRGTEYSRHLELIQEYQNRLAALEREGALAQAYYKQVVDFAAAVRKEHANAGLAPAKPPAMREQEIQRLAAGKTAEAFYGHAWTFEVSGPALPGMPQRPAARTPAKKLPAPKKKG